MGIEWSEAKAKYFRGESGLRGLAALLGVSERTVFRRAKAERWVDRRQQIVTDASEVMRQSALTKAAELGATLAEQTADGFKIRMGRTTAVLANRLDELASQGDVGPSELRTIAASVRDTWAIGSEIHGLADPGQLVQISVDVLAALPDRAMPEAVV